MAQTTTPPEVSDEHRLTIADFVGDMAALGDSRYVAGGATPSGSRQRLMRINEIMPGVVIRELEKDGHRADNDAGGGHARVGAPDSPGNSANPTSGCPVLRVLPRDTHGLLNASIRTPQLGDQRSERSAPSVPLLRRYPGQTSRLPQYIARDSRKGRGPIGPRPFFIRP